MSRNNFRVELSNEYLGKSKIITAPTRYELSVKMNQQKAIWDKEVARKLEIEEKEALKEKASNLTRDAKQVLSIYSNLLKSINYISYDKYYESLYDNNEFESYNFSGTEPTKEMIKKQLKVPNKNVFEKVFSSLEEKRKIKEQSAEELFEKATKSYLKDKSAYDKKYKIDKDKFIAAKNEHNDFILERKKNFANGDVREIESYFLYLFSKMNFPFDIDDIGLEYKSKIKTLVVSVKVPKVENLPKVKEYKFVSSKNKIEKIEMSNAEFEEFYNNLVFMICLKFLKVAFESDITDCVNDMVYNAWADFVDKSNGKDTSSCILSLKTSKSQFLDINLQKVVYKDCIKGLKGIFAPNLLSFTPVIPIMDIDREDSRFVENKNIDNILFDGSNLASMNWEDFEYFIRELFSKMFNENGSEVKITRASRDGGVDAIAFDNDAIRGGKFVIQAKRYNNTVPVSAVRDLYGTMIHEGATKGILVTTSSFGKDSYDFASDKPISLIDGSGLLGYLKKFGYENLTIKIKEKVK